MGIIYRNGIPYGGSLKEAHEISYDSGTVNTPSGISDAGSALDDLYDKYSDLEGMDDKIKDEVKDKIDLITAQDYPQEFKANGNFSTTSKAGTKQYQSTLLNITFNDDGSPSEDFPDDDNARVLLEKNDYTLRLDTTHKSTDDEW